MFTVRPIVLRLVLAAVGFAIPFSDFFVRVPAAHAEGFLIVEMQASFRLANGRLVVVRSIPPQVYFSGGVYAPFVPSAGEAWSLWVRDSIQYHFPAADVGSLVIYARGAYVKRAVTDRTYDTWNFVAKPRL
jgi:hypothetical protein